MKNPVFQIISVRLVGVILLAFGGDLRGQETPNSPDNRANKATARQRTKPQVIFHVRRTSNYSATLHSQAKTPNNSNQLPVDDTMPTSLQLSRGNANAEREAQAQTPAPDAPSRPKIRRPRAPRNQFARPPRFMKFHGRGNPHGNKPHKR